VPVIGTAIGGIAGGILGSLFGEKLGEGAATAMQSTPKAPVALAAAGAVSINIYPQAGQDAGAIADEVMRRIEKARGGRLHD